jgi:hypothetical protein
MQLFQQPFDANQVKPQEVFDPLPDGYYNARVINSEAKPTKDNESGYLALELEVIDGEYKGRKLFDNLNLWNKSAQATEIAQRQLSAYCHATGVIVINDSTQLHGIPVKVKVGTKSDPGYDPRNVIKAVKHIQDGAASAAMPTAPTTPFGQNPSLPPMPAQPTAPQMPWSQSQPTGPNFAQSQPAPQQPWGKPAPQQSTPQQPWAQQPQGAPMQSAPSGPTPPWRK